MAFGREVSEKLTHMMAATAICCTAVTVAPGLGVLALVEALLGGAAVAHAVVQRRSAKADALLRRCAGQVESGSDAWIETEFRGDPEARVRRDEAIVAIKDVIPLIVPKAEELVAARLRESDVTVFYLGRASRARPDAFADVAENAIARRLFVDVVRNAYRLIISQPEFAAEVLQRTLAELLEGQEDIRGDLAKLQESVDRQTRDLPLSQAEREALTTELVRVKAEQNGTVELVAGFLETMVGRRVPPEQFSTVLFRIVADWKIAGERIDVLSASRNLSPQLAKLKAEAQAAHRAGQLDVATAKLAEIRHIETEALDRLDAHEQEIQQERRLRRIGIAETRVAEAAVARARLAYREAAGHYSAAARAIASVDSREEWRYILASARALGDLGREFGDNAALVQAIELYRNEALPRAPRAQRAKDWAMTQNNLGNALSTLGERESGTARLEEAVAAYRAALQARTRERVPLDWAMTQNNLGNALRALGERESGTSLLEEAVAAYRAALQEWTCERVPLDWATTQNNLGTALRALGERESGTSLLEEAVAAYRAALLQRTRERVPLGWAMTQNNLGTALRALGERESGTSLLEEAVAAYRAAPQERTGERVPLDWAATQNNLGNALETLGARESGTARLEEAVAAYDAALAAFVPAQADYYTGLCRVNRDRALALLAQRKP